MPTVWFGVGAALLAIFLLGSGVVIGLRLAQHPPGGSAPVTGQPASSTRAPAPTPQLCVGYVSSGEGLQMAVALTVPEGCVVVINAVQGRISGLSWSKGGVVAFPAGAYTGYMIDGTYQLFAAASGEVKFCQTYKSDLAEGHPIAFTQPLDGWNDWMSAC